MIYDWNDDVLREIFGDFNFEELAAVADVCSTFRRVAGAEFVSRYEEVVLIGRQVANQENNINILYVGYPHWNSILRKFGHVMTSIRMNRNDRRRHVPLKAIAQYCSESLMELELTRPNWTNGMILEWQPLLSRLRKLTLRQCEFEAGADASRMLSFCVELHSLTIEIMDPAFFESPIILPKLKSLEIRYMKWTRQTVLNWQPSLAGLQELKLDHLKDELGANGSHLFSLCVELHSLSLFCDDELVLDSPVALPQLKSLDLHLSCSDVTTVMEQLLSLNPQLEEIRLLHPSSRQMVEMVEYYVPNIAKLELQYGEGAIEDWNIFKNLKSVRIDFRPVVFAPEPALAAFANVTIPLERIGFTCLRVDPRDRQLSDQILKFKSLKELELDRVYKLNLPDIVTLIENLPDLRRISLILLWSDLPFAGIPEIIKCGPKLQSMTYTTHRKDYVDDDLFLRIRDAVMNHSEHRPFRLHFDPLSCVKMNVSWKLLKVNSRILQIRPLDCELEQ